MYRRRYLAALATATALAGCSTASPRAGDDSNGDREGGQDVTDPGNPAVAGSGDSTPTDTPGGRPGDRQVSGPGDVDLPIPRSDLISGAEKNAIPAIVDPVFGPDWSDAEAGDGDLALSPDDTVIGVERGGAARAYPLRILDWHEIVNDTLDGPLLVTYCPLCGSGVTAERTVGGAETLFGVSGLLWKSDLVMYDEKTGSLWSQILATAIQGPETGTKLDLLPSTMTTWGEWQAAHDDATVLLPPPESGTIVESRPRNYALEAYAGYEQSKTVGLGVETDDGDLHPKTLVIGITDGDATKAYPLGAVRKAGVVNDTVGGLAVVVTATGAGSLFAYERTVDGETLSFEAGDGGHLRAGGSRWAVTTGLAVDGPHEGARLARANDRSPMFWFAWRDFYTETGLYG